MRNSTFAIVLLGAALLPLAGLADATTATTVPPTTTTSPSTTQPTTTR